MAVAVAVPAAAEEAPDLRNRRRDTFEAGGPGDKG